MIRKMCKLCSMVKRRIEEWLFRWPPVTTLLIGAMGLKFYVDLSVQDEGISPNPIWLIIFSAFVSIGINHIYANIMGFLDYMDEANAKEFTKSEIELEDEYFQKGA